MAQNKQYGPIQHLWKYGIENIWNDVVKDKLEMYEEIVYEHGNIEHEAAIELAAKLHWGLRTEVTIEEYEEEERRQTLEKRQKPLKEKQKKERERRRNQQKHK